MTKILKWLGAIFIGFLIFKGATTDIKVEASTVGQLTKEKSSYTGRMEFRRYGATQNSWEDYMIIKVNGVPAICFDPTTYVYAGQYTGTAIVGNEQITSTIQLTPEKLRQMTLVSYFGYQLNPTDKNYHYLQGLGWEILVGGEMQSYNNGLSIEEFRQWKSNVLAQVDAYKQLASFHGQTHTLKVGQSITLVDTNNVLQKLTIPASQNGYVFNRNGNQLTITATKDAVDGNIEFRQPLDNLIHGTSILYRKPGSQTVGVLKLQDPQRAELNLHTVKKAQIVINKTSSTTGKGISGVEFTLYDATTNKAVKTAVTNANGVAEFLDLDAGRKFYFKETRAVKGYMLNETRYDYTVVAGETKTFNVKNEPVPTIVSKAATVNGQKQAFAHEIQHERLTVSDLTIGNTYTLVSFQMDKNTRRQLSDTQKVTFKATSNTYTHTFAYNNIASTYQGDVVYGAWLYSADGKKIAEHFDFENKAQTVTVVKPGMTSTATGPNGQKIVHAIEPHKETVNVTGLIPQLNYRLVSFAMSGTNQKQIGDFQSIMFKPTGNTYTHTFTYNGLQPTYHGDVVYGARLYYGNRLLHEHFDFNNKAQTVNVVTPTIVTVATTQNGQKSGYRDEKHIEKATIKHVIAGRTYTLIARQYDKSGKLYATQTRTIKPTASTHVETFEFSVPAGFSGYLVYAQELLLDGKHVANHFDLNNASQTVYVDEPEVTTVATTVTGGKVGYEYEDHKEIANVTGLIIGRQYKLVATQYDKTGKAYATQEATFTATTKTYTHEFIFTVPVGFKGHLVYGEELYDGANKVALHYDLENKDQTVEIIEPEIVTKATTVSGGKVGYQYEDHKEIAELKGLIIGRKYKIVATQYDENGKVYATQRRTFIADKTTRTEVFTFKVPVGFSGTIVYGEDLYSEGKKVTTHYDLKSIPQSVKVIKPTISTIAKAGGKTELVKGQKVTVTDTLTYANFKNEEVAVKTWIVKYGTDEKVSEVYTRIVKLNGKGEVTITLDDFETSKLPVGKYTLMEQVFEVKDGQVTEQLISQHTNNKDEKQTFTVKAMPETASNDSNSTLTVVAVGALGLVALTFKRKKEDK